MRWEQQSKAVIRQIVQAFEYSFPKPERQNQDGPNRVVAINQLFALYDAGGPYGLTEQNENGIVYKDVFYALANLLNLMRDNGVEHFDPGSLQIEFIQKPSGFLSILTQKSNGEFYLIHWRNRPVWDDVNFSDPGGDDEAPVELVIGGWEGLEFLHLEPQVNGFWDSQNPPGTVVSPAADGRLTLTTKDKIQILRIREAAPNGGFQTGLPPVGAVIEPPPTPGLRREGSRRDDKGIPSNRTPSDPGPSAGREPKG